MLTIPPGEIICRIEIELVYLILNASVDLKMIWANATEVGCANKSCPAYDVDPNVLSNFYFICVYNSE